MKSEFKIPFYAKAALISISVFALTYTLIAGQAIIVPIVLATILAILFNPLVNAIARKVNRLISISLSVFIATLIAVGIVYVISAQISMVSEVYPQLKSKFTANSTELLHWTAKTFNIRESSIREWSSNTQSDAIADFAIGEKLTQAGRVLVIILLLPVYLFLILYYKTLLLEFVRRLFVEKHQSAVTEVLTNTKQIIQRYLVGLFFEMIIVGVMNSAGLLILGIDYAIILGFTGAILNIVPYIGGIIAITLPMLIAYATTDSLTSPILVFVIYLVIQFIDNHFIVPKIVASRVQINALISIIVVLVGGAIWGVPGMFLSIPLTAIAKVVCDHIEPLKPWGFLLGNIVPTSKRFPLINSVAPLELPLTVKH
jgi:predicted PurR-regulated permease PerM